MTEDAIQKQFNQLIGETAHCLSSLLIWSTSSDANVARQQTLRLQAEALIDAGNKIAGLVNTARL